MTAQPFDEGRATIIPQPPMDADALRVAVARLTPEDSALFEQKYREAWNAAYRTSSTQPMRAFLVDWSIRVAVHRIPERARRWRDLEYLSMAAPNREASRAASAALGELLRAAEREVLGR
ncbi:hypothetical protein [Yinghuangia seranimata]|uniref:hypothetical protein n=1 Tax=Yinghuangia seranimata TaxID=408067 RepID=UPI00248A9B2B|nr:hypothetical protein [Yinghuangia seranimata]MDI2127252.1 hypothetical protein [Yinghuangia seranimata]MDI2132197.1 hypothetical protein [Yinghuangia seranimata]